MKPVPKWGVMLITAASLALYTGLAAWGWGGWSAFLAHPARAGAVIVMAVLSVAAMFTSGNLSSGRREDTKNRWILLPFLVPGLVLGWLPAYTDRQDIWTIDGDAVRYLGLALFVVGSVLRVGAVFVLWRRFSGLVAIQEGHELVTGGLYRVIRHPIYTSMLCLFAGTGFMITPLPILLLSTLLFIAGTEIRVRIEDRLLASRFGEPFQEYRRTVPAYIPFVR